MSQKYVINNILLFDLSQLQISVQSFIYNVV